MDREEFNIEIKKCHSGTQAHDVCLKYIESLEGSIEELKVDREFVIYQLETEIKYLKGRIEGLCNSPYRGNYE